MPFFTVVIPSYNRANIIANTIQSVQDQLFSDWECLIVDDGSSDHTRAVVEAFSEKDQRIRYIYQENAERSAARNNGIHHAEGEYVCFLDSDDTFCVNHLQVLYDAIQQNTSEDKLYYTDMTIITDQGEQKVSDPLEEDIFHFLTYHPIIPARICVASKIIKNNLFDRDIVVVEDLILWLRLADQVPFYHIPAYTVNYHLHGGNSVDIANTGYQKRLAGLKIFQKRYKTIWDKLAKKDKAYLIGNTHFGIAKHYIYHKKKGLAIKELICSILRQKKHAQLKHKIYLIIQLLTKRIDKLDK